MANRIPPSAARMSRTRVAAWRSAMLRVRLPGRPLMLAGALAVVLTLLAALAWNGGSLTAAQDSEAEVPVRPTGLRVSTEAGSLDVAADWDDVAGAEEYRVRWRLSGPGQELNEGVRTERSDAKITVNDYGRWVVRVEACNEAGCGPGAAKTVQVALPERPQNLAVSVTKGELDVTASWDEAKGATSYKVRWRRPDGGFAAGDRVTTTEANANFKVSAHGNWVARVEGCNDAGCGPGVARQFNVEPAPEPEPSPEPTPEPAPQPEPPARPAKLQVQVQPDPQEFAASWSGVKDATHYRLRWQKWGARSKGSVRELEVKATRATFRVSKLGEWLVQVEACNDDGCSAGSARKFAAVPGKPTGLQASTEAGSLQVSVDWDDVNGATYYRVRWREAEAGSGLNNGAKVRSSDAVITVADHGDWVVWVEACIDAGCGPRVKQTVAVAAAARVYSYRPGHLFLPDRSDCGPNRITGIDAYPIGGGVEVRWSNPSDADITKYQYHFQKDGFNTELIVWVDADGTNADTTSFTLTGLENGTTYGITLQALAGSKTYCFDRLIWVTPSDPTIASPPTGFRVEPVNGASRSLELSWDDPDDDTLSYEYEYVSDRPSDQDASEWPKSQIHPWTTVENDDLTKADGRLTTIITGLTCSYRHQFILRARRGDAIGPLTVHRSAVPGLYLTGRDDTQDVADEAGDCVMGLGGNDELVGNKGRDWLHGGAGNDVLKGNGGKDWIYGGAGSDELNGGDGDDWLKDEYYDAGADVLRGGPGNDHMIGGAGDDVMHGNEDNDWMLGQQGNDVMHGNSGDDAMNGGQGNDTLRGGAGDDQLYGGQGNDTLRGNSGDDAMNGGQGNDTLRGDAGVDAFYFEGVFGNDTITDYALAATKADSEKIYLCMGTETNVPTQTGADNDSDGDSNADEHVITVAFNSGTAGTITLQGITTGSDNFGNLNVVIPASSGETCSD